jgi:hypothetical protein
LDRDLVAQAAHHQAETECAATANAPAPTPTFTGIGPAPNADAHGQDAERAALEMAPGITDDDLMRAIPADEQ